MLKLEYWGWRADEIGEIGRRGESNDEMRRDEAEMR